ncbi:hypothetical protein [Sphingomonas sp. SORGH_AS_0879]|uniref:hypothetical protein n=1 Tax=Sphingomonas sp. SORGH_AS_0879 TaxID=3041790 RepID=UPI0027D83E41|nr:hypothetical protein [Sphingomonas sp. SORGH_AS_0879]
MVGAKAAYAYDKGITGKGVTIAVIDTGIATSSAEFAGRISPDSKAFESRIARCATCAPETVTFPLDVMCRAMALRSPQSLSPQEMAPACTASPMTRRCSR